MPQRASVKALRDGEVVDRASKGLDALHDARLVIVGKVLDKLIENAKDVCAPGATDQMGACEA